MQLLCRIETQRHGNWRAEFDGEAETRGNAGLTLLQLWREADAPDTMLALFEVNDRERAAAYLGTDASLSGTLGSCTFLETA
ncbi:hypothetical protein [Roseitranquillus sediminis]|uniref:hypothetical protein n=1 Tax=Roseitranquillus sediminis TaxID=2809051 RepID=UPI001D0BFC4E|nr:hypothetical protein [Roseitranquillus sediminis]MBM9594802.1 hypothetical protein [Roseitranquillus sediminis]